MFLELDVLKINICVSFSGLYKWPDRFIVVRKVIKIKAEIF